MKLTIKQISYYADWFAFLWVPLVLSFFVFKENAYMCFSLWGEYALWILLFVVFIKPLLVVRWHPIQYTLLLFRRHLGITSFWFALFHSRWTIREQWWWKIDLFLWRNNYLFWWGCALIGMIILGVTTNYYTLWRTD